MQIVKHNKYKYIVEVDLAQLVREKDAVRGWQTVSRQREALEEELGVPVELVIQFINERPAYS